MSTQAKVQYNTATYVPQSDITPSYQSSNHIPEFHATLALHVSNRGNKSFHSAVAAWSRTPPAITSHGITRLGKCSAKRTHTKKTKHKSVTEEGGCVHARGNERGERKGIEEKVKERLHGAVIFHKGSNQCLHVLIMHFW